ncbi:MAG: hypothetical protein ABSB70_19755 [Candidatus Velthaea sp.]|jgi:hypothetical protein
MEDGCPPDQTREDPLDVHRALQNVLLFGILPRWIVPGFLDYVLHRKSSIETTSGTHESLIHALQMTSIGIPTLLALLCEVNAAIIATSIGAALLHETLTFRDIAYAEPLRRPEPNEQHVHSFLEVLPVMALTTLLTLHPAQTAALFGRGTKPPVWRLRPKEPALRGRYLAAVAAAVTSFLVVPYAEELLRCYRTDRTFAAHRSPQPGDSVTR